MYIYIIIGLGVSLLNLILSMTVFPNAFRKLTIGQKVMSITMTTVAWPVNVISLLFYTVIFLRTGGNYQIFKKFKDEVEKMDQVMNSE